MVFSFGGNGFFGYSSGGPASSQQLMWWSTYETSSLPSSTPLDPLAIKAALLERHQHWRDPIIQDIIAKAEVTSIYPTWTLPTLPHWGQHGMVLVGDAAHAMDPTTGQGASQAMEDAETFALLLKRFFTNYGEDGVRVVGESQVVQAAIATLHHIRAPRVEKIVERGRKIAGRKGNVGIVGEYFMYGFLWLMNRFPAFGKFLG